MPKISVLSPAYNHGQYVREAVQSVLSQTFTDFEYIISDDASTDDTVARIKEFNDPRLVVITNENNCGESVNSGRCFFRSSGEYVSWLTTDDVYEPNALAVLSSFLDANPNVIGVFGGARFIDENGTFTGEEWKKNGVGMNRFQLLNSIFCCKHLFCPPASTMRRKALERVNYLSPNVRQVSDMGMWIKLLFSGEIVIIPDLIFRFRNRDGQNNVSAPTEENVARFNFELSEILELFSEHIKTFDTLSKVFPEVLERSWPAEDRFVPFYLARLALEFEHPSHSLFGLRLLYRVYSSESLAKELKEKLNFGYPEYFALTGSTKVFYELEPYAQRETVHQSTDGQTAQADELLNQIAALTNRRDELKQLSDRYQAEIQVLQGTLEERGREITATSAETSAVVNSLMDRCRELEEVCHQYASSSSWRLTAPIRQLKQSVLSIRTR